MDSDEDELSYEPVCPVEPSVEPVVAGIPAGLRTYDAAKSAHSVCKVCKVEIAKGRWRFRYRFRTSNAFRDEASIHFECFPKLPRRAADLATIQEWRDSGTVAARAAFGEVLLNLDFPVAVTAASSSKS